MNYYNEIDKKVAAWLRELIKRDLIAPGEVDERSIEDVVPSDLKGFTQCHFFAGIGGWSYALRLAGWPDDKPVWTGSCPCQPFSQTGKGIGFEDERHLWPAFQHLIQQCQPPEVYGEQVSGQDGFEWLDLVQTDLEGMAYTFAALPFPSASVGAPHIRDRIYWFAANSSYERDSRRQPSPSISQVRPWGAFSQVDMQSIIDRPYDHGRYHDQPLIRALDDGLSDRVVRIGAYGNAINPYAAKAFIEATQEALSDLEALQTAVAA